MADSSLSSQPRFAEYDAIVIGSGPNGLAAAVCLAGERFRVLVVEGHGSAGGGARTEELTEPGFRHDVCSAAHPMGVASPFFRILPLESHGLEWIHPTYPLVHPLEGDRAVVQEHSVEATAERLGRKDGRAYRRLFAPLVKNAEKLFVDLLAPLSLPQHPFAMAGMGVRALPSALSLARAWFHDEPARALLAGNAAHSVLPLDRSPSAAVGLMLQMAGHAVGWPVAKGGSQSIANALVSLLRQRGGEVVCGFPWVERLEDLPKAKVYLFDTSPRAMARIAADRLPEDFQKRLRHFRHGPGVFKVDYALNAPIPWTAEEARKAGTVHVGGYLDQVVAAEAAPWKGQHHERPFVLVAQQSVCDPTRAPEGKHTAWAYCHVPNGSTRDMKEFIDAQIERFAPGFRDCVIAASTRNTEQMEAYNPNLVGGDVIGGVTDWWQLYTRPVARLNPYTTPAEDVFLCSASTPPGGGVHGMCGYWAARSALSYLERL